MEAGSDSKSITFLPGECPSDMVSARCTNDHFKVAVYPASNVVMITADGCNYSEKAIEGTLELVFQDRVVATARLIHKAAVYTDSDCYVYKNNDIVSAYIGDFPYKPKSDKSFVSAQIAEGYLHIRCDATTENRSATISFDEISWKITVHQTKYAQGDFLTVDGLNCKAQRIPNGFMESGSPALGYLLYSLPGEYKWSTEEVYLGCLSASGLVNTQNVMEVPNWESLYPAFAAVNTLNKDGQLKWFLPSKEELGYSEGKYAGAAFSWSSSEYGSQYAYYYSVGGPGWPNSWSTKLKNKENPVVAMREYDFFAE